MNRPRRTDATPPNRGLRTQALKATPPRVSYAHVPSTSAETRRRLSTLGQKDAGFENDGLVANSLMIRGNQDDESLTRTVGGVVTRFGAKSKVGVVPMNPNKVNQDSHWELDNFGSDPTQYYFGVADGHGYQGKEVSDMIRKRLPLHLARDPAMKADTKMSFGRTFMKMNQELVRSSLDVSFSGSTCVTCLIRGTTAYGANVGDSRAIIARHENGEWRAVKLSNDHKPDLPSEKIRIQKANGRVEAFRGAGGKPVGPQRVWLKNQDAPGLAMSRSMGDAVAASVGVIAEPEIIAVPLLPMDKFIILASDGVWEFMTNQEAIRICAPYCQKGDVNGALTAIVKDANARWTREEDVVDDITAVIVLLDVPP